MTTARNPGRPNGNAGGRAGDTKLAIERSAADAFATLGFEKATIRKIATDAGVDPKLVVHYFGTKAELFAKTFSMPSGADQIRTLLATVPSADWGTAVVNVLFDGHTLLASEQVAGFIRASTTHPDGAAPFGELAAQNSIGPFLASIGIDHPTLRAATLESFLLGLSYTDSVLEIPLSPQEDFRRRKALIAAVIQKILTEDLG